MNYCLIALKEEFGVQNWLKVAKDMVLVWSCFTSYLVIGVIKKDKFLHLSPLLLMLKETRNVYAYWGFRIHSQEIRHLALLIQLFYQG